MKSHPLGPAFFVPAASWEGFLEDASPAHEPLLCEEFGASQGPSVLAAARRVLFGMALLDDAELATRLARILERMDQREVQGFTDCLKSVAEALDQAGAAVRAARQSLDLPALPPLDGGDDRRRGKPPRLPGADPDGAPPRPLWQGEGGEAVPRRPTRSTDSARRQGAMAGAAAHEMSEPRLPDLVPQAVARAIDRVLPGPAPFGPAEYRGLVRLLALLQRPEVQQGLINAAAGLPGRVSNAAGSGFDSGDLVVALRDEVQRLADQLLFLGPAAPGRRPDEDALTDWLRGR
ncbi:hypothetical protein [Frigidibacter oleivorans]|uniref:hypothetical protein n=1 Tax=Frigidibacter oleivorans TaxID=2487129 RepID=UPI000F8E5CDB|nr:hypothetical protein [Frigidibacter oleivorans]